LIGIGVALALMMSRTQTTDVILLRGLGMPFTVLPSGEVVNPARIKISNRENEGRTYVIDVRKASRRASCWTTSPCA
jgi:hypothetical protein